MDQNLNSPRPWTIEIHTFYQLNRGLRQSIGKSGQIISSSLHFLELKRAEQKMSRADLEFFSIST
jgi:hypothetical protein